MKATPRRRKPTLTSPSPLRLKALIPPALLICTDETSPFQLGGQPLDDVQQTQCRHCQTPEQFLGRFDLDTVDSSLPERTLQLFMCRNDTCETWDPESGTNHALIVASGHRKATPKPVAGDTVKFSKLIGLDEDLADSYFELPERERFLVVGKFGGQPKKVR